MPVKHGVASPCRTAITTTCGSIQTTQTSLFSRMMAVLMSLLTVAGLGRLRIINRRLNYTRLILARNFHIGYLQVNKITRQFQCQVYRHGECLAGTRHSGNRLVVVRPDQLYRSRMIRTLFMRTARVDLDSLIDGQDRNNSTTLASGTFMDITRAT